MIYHGQAYILDLAIFLWFYVEYHAPYPTKKVVIFSRKVKEQTQDIHMENCMLFYLIWNREYIVGMRKETSLNKG